MAFGFGNTQTATTGGGLFGGGSNTQTTTGGGLFGQNTQQQPAQQSSGLFGQPAQQQQQPQSTGLLGQPAQQQQQQPQNTGLFGQPAQQQQGGGLFGQQQPQQQQTSAFGQTQQQPQQSLFGQPQQQQQPQQQPSMFGQTLQQPQQQQNQLGQTQWQSQPQPGQAQPVPEQMKSILEQWMPQSSTCKFRTYFYNKVPDHLAPFAQPGPQDDLKAWDEALSKKPAHGYIPVLCVGFEQLGLRIQAQQRELAVCNTAMHQINGSLEANMTKHDTSTSVRILEAKRKHVALTQRTLALATKVQIMRNRGYAMDPAEEALKAKLENLEKNVCDPQILARSEEIWARMVQVQARSQWLEKEMAKQAGAIASGLSEEDARRAEKVLEDYATNLTHLKKELVAISKEFEEWQKEQGAHARRR